MTIDRRKVLASAAGFALAPSLVHAQSWPVRPVRVMVPYPPGGGADTVSRILFAKLSERIGQQFIIENRGGAGGTIAAGIVAAAPADGYTVLYDATAFSVNPALFQNLPFDYARDFTPVFLSAVVPNLLLVNPNVQQRTVADIIAHARATPGGLEWASSGNGTAQHLALELFRLNANIRLNHIPYRGGGPALNDLMAGVVNYFFSNASSSVGHVRAGTLRAVAHTATGRLAVLPEVPAVADTLPGFEALEWNGVFFRTGTPAEMVSRLNEGLNAVIADPAVVERLNSLTVTSRANTPAQFAQFVAAETAKWGRVVREANIRIE